MANRPKFALGEKLRWYSNKLNKYLVGTVSRWNACNEWEYILVSDTDGIWAVNEHLLRRLRSK